MELGVLFVSSEEDPFPQMVAMVLAGCTMAPETYTEPDLTDSAPEFFLHPEIIKRKTNTFAEFEYILQCKPDFMLLKYLILSLR